MKYFFCLVPRIYGKWCILLLSAATFYVIEHDILLFLFCRLNNYNFFNLFVYVFIAVIFVSLICFFFSSGLFLQFVMTSLNQLVEGQEVKDGNFTY